MSKLKKARKRPSAKKIEYLSLGCDKNLVDTEKALARFCAKGFHPVKAGSGGEAIIINTCSFIDPAKQESIEQILLAVERKKRGEIKKIIVAGCLVELFKKELAQEIPEVDLWIKFSELENWNPENTWVGQALPLHNKPHKPRFITTPKHISYLKIAEGCDKGCKFCIIPKIRGSFRSLSIKDLLAEAVFLEESGVKELNLVAQDLCAYGHDIDSSLTRLLEKILAHTKIPWLRLFYLNPEGVSKELIGLIAKEDRICKYIDLPFQHISDRVLKAMGRRAREKKIRSLVSELKAKIPGVSLRGTLLTGFPGESDDDFEKLMEFVEGAGFDWLGVFAYSPQEGTRAFALPGRVPEAIAQKRKRELEELFRNLAAEKNRGKIDKVFKVLVDGRSDSGFDYQARSQAQAYDIDGVIQVKGKCRPGVFYQAEIIDSLGVDLLGVII